MNSYMLFALGSLAICLFTCFYHFIRIVRLGKPSDFSKPLGETGPAVRYALTRAMDPRKKESAFLHLPTYTAGILYHLGTFLSIFLFVFFLFKLEPQGILRLLIICFLVVSGVSGLAILIKRILKKELRALSNADDFISNLLVTIVQLITATTLFNVRYFPVYFVVVSILLLYLPVGKLKHTIYFFAARYHLGIFYGRRGVWPPK
jgi:hypothetical protein